MGTTQIQDRTAEFKTIVAQAERRQASSKVGSQRRSLLTDAQKSAADSHGPPRRSEFARKVGPSVLQRDIECRVLTWRRRLRLDAGFLQRWESWKNWRSVGHPSRATRTSVEY